MKKKHFFSFLIVVLAFQWAISTPTFAKCKRSIKPTWGQTGHRVVGEIATRYLSKKAKKNIKKIIGDTTLADCSNWMDNIKSDRSYRYMSPWHYINIDEGETFEQVKRNKKGDILSAIDKMSKVLEDKNSTKAQKSLALKCLVHLVADIHQPLHVGHKSDRGGNDVKVKWFREDSNIHRVWDTEMIDSKGLSFSELADFIDHPTSAQLEQWRSSKPVTWMKESHALATKVYNDVGDGEFSYRYRYKYFPVVKQRLLQGGVRLADLLNDLLG